MASFLQSSQEVSVPQLLASVNCVTLANSPCIKTGEGSVLRLHDISPPGLCFMEPCKVNSPSSEAFSAINTPQAETMQQSSTQEKDHSTSTSADNVHQSKAIGNVLATKQTTDSSTLTDTSPERTPDTVPTLQIPPAALTVQTLNVAPTLQIPTPTPNRERIPLSRPFEPQRRDTEDGCGICILAPFVVVGFIVLLFVLISGKKPYGSAFSSREPSA